MSGRGLSKIARSLANKQSSEAPCSFKEYNCSLPRIDLRAYCVRHILEDKSAPYRQCNFIYPSSIKRCHRASPLTDRTEGFCQEHSQIASYTRSKSLFRKQADETPQICFEQLSHHSIDSTSLSSFQHPVPDPSNVASIVCDTLEYSLDNEPERRNDVFEATTFKDLPRLDDDSELEDIDSDNDVLEHAGVYTTEEASRMYTNNLEKLKRMYENEFEKLTNILKDGRKEYIQAAKIEKESMRSVSRQPKITMEDKKSYEVLKCMTRYHKRYGKEAILYKDQASKKVRLAGMKSATPVGTSFKCIYSEGSSWKCGEVVVPLSKHCFKHILQDSHQILFEACGAAPMNGIDACEVPIIPLPHIPTCIYHTPLPEIRPMSPLPISPLEQEDNTGGLNALGTNSFKVGTLPPTDVMEGDR